MSDTTPGTAPIASNRTSTGPAPSMATVPRARFRFRHFMVVVSFLMLVVGPSAASYWYLWERASDRYVSTIGFSVRTEEVGSAIEMLGGIAELSGSSSSDTEILYNFIQSQELVRAINARINLREIWAKGDPDTDPLFAYHPPGTIEDLVAYWRRMVAIYDADAGLLEVQVQAFDPADAQRIAQEIYDESTTMINRLSAIARQDATFYAREELESAEARLVRARLALTQFRNETQIVDPSASVQSQMGLLSSLQLQLAEALIDLDILRQTTTAPNDPRLTQLERRVSVIEGRMDEERRKLGIASDGNEGENPFSELVGRFEELSAERDFAQESFTAARAAYEASLAEARRQSRYIAAHIRPTLAEAPHHPRRYTLWGLTTLFAFLSWGILVLAAYALRDRS